MSVAGNIALAVSKIHILKKISRKMGSVLFVLEFVSVLDA